MSFKLEDGKIVLDFHSDTMDTLVIMALQAGRNNVWKSMIEDVSKFDGENTPAYVKQNVIDNSHTLACFDHLIYYYGG